MLDHSATESGGTSGVELTYIFTAALPIFHNFAYEYGQDATPEVLNSLAEARSNP